MRKHQFRSRRARGGFLAGLALAAMIAAPSEAGAQPAPIVIDDTRVFPESLTSAADGTIFIGSLDHGTIYRAQPGAAKATPWIAAAPNGLNMVLGVFAHDTSNTLYVCSNDPDPKSVNDHLRTFNLTTGAPKADFPFPGGGFCNDVAVTCDGRTFVTDTRGGRILTLALGGTALDVWASDPAWVGIDGIAMMGNGSVLFNNVRQNQLVRVDVKADGTAGATTVLELSRPISAPDGMRALPDGGFALAENKAGKVDIVHVDGNKAMIETVRDGFKFTPTAVTVIGDVAWVLEARFAYRNDPALKGQDPGTFSVTPVPIPKR